MQAHLLAAALLLASTSVHAAEVTALPVIVTATRTAQTADEALVSVTVITREDIERRQATSVEDLLRGMPGIDLGNNGGPGKATSVFLRGAESSHVLTLIDGVKVSSATTGTAAFQDILIDQIERIEIVRGPRSRLYGSEAIDGVIQIFTFGNPSLKPQESKIYELGLRGKASWAGWSLNAYQTDIDNLIALTAPAINIDAARIRGLEAAASTQIAGWVAGTSLTLLDPQT